MKVGVSAPDRSFRRYLEDTAVSLTPRRSRRIRLEFTMTDSDDANGRLEFNMGAAGSTAGIRISNVSLKKIRRDRDYRRGQGHPCRRQLRVQRQLPGRRRASRILGCDRKTAGAEVSVTNENNIRRLMVNAPEGTSADNPVIVSQSDLALSAGNTYAMSFTAEGEAGKNIMVKAAGQEYTRRADRRQRQQYDYKLTLDAEPADTDLAFCLRRARTILS